MLVTGIMYHYIIVPLAWHAVLTKIVCVATSQLFMKRVPSSSDTSCIACFQGIKIKSLSKF